MAGEANVIAPGIERYCQKGRRALRGKSAVKRVNFLLS